MATVFFSLGTNLGDREKNLRQALRGMGRFLHLTAVSPIYETAPWGPITDQPPFLNLCCGGKTALDPAALLRRCKDLERSLGRETGERWGPRLIDIDLLFYDDLVLASEPPIVPHPQIEKRGFVLRPLADIAAEFVHPVLRTAVAGLLAAVSTDDIQWFKPAVPLSHLFPWGRRTFIMGIVNVTPDSFSGDGVWSETAGAETAAARAVDFVRQGADIIDIGGESSRPGAEPVGEAAELERVLPALEAIRAALPGTTLSIDTVHPGTAAAALDAGADWINDISGEVDPDGTVGVAARAGCPIILMHNGRRRPRHLAPDGAGGEISVFQYEDLLGEMALELAGLAQAASAAGEPSDQIILDPGLGFGKAGPQNLAILRHLDRFKALGYPLLVGSSRKGFIGHYLGGLPPDDRLEGTAATVALAIAGGADIVRVHDVEAMARVARLSDLICRQPAAETFKTGNIP